MDENQIYQKLAALCARSEHCAHDMAERMRRWQVPEEVQAAVIERLVRERFVDDERYARAFVKDKIKYSKWGSRKIEQALRMKRIDEKTINEVLGEVDDSEYVAVLRPLLTAKRRTTKAESDYEMRCKLVRFALSRGFTMELVEDVL